MWSFCAPRVFLESFANLPQLLRQEFGGTPHRTSTERDQQGSPPPTRHPCRHKSSVTANRQVEFSKSTRVLPCPVAGVGLRGGTRCLETVT